MSTDGLQEGFGQRKGVVSVSWWVEKGNEIVYGKTVWVAVVKEW